MSEQWLVAVIPHRQAPVTHWLQEWAVYGPFASRDEACAFESGLQLDATWLTRPVPLESPRLKEAESA